MGKLTLSFTNPTELRHQIGDVAHAFGIDLETPKESLALYSNEELMAELALRTGPPAMPEEPAPAKPNGSVAVKTVHKRGRPAGALNKKTAEKEEPQAATAKVTSITQGRPAAPPPAAPVDQSSNVVAVSLPAEDEVLGLMSEVYSLAGGNMDIVREIMLSVGGKTQLTQISPDLWPALVTRLTDAHAKLTAEKAAKT